MLKKLFQQVIRFFARLFSSHSKPFEFPKGSKKPPIRPIIFVPGSSASIQRFNGTIRMLHRFSRKKQSLLKIKVNKDDSIPHQLVIDLSKVETVTGFRYLPRAEKNYPGMIKEYRVYVKPADFKY